MPKLYLLRHAQAEGGFDKNDKDRALTTHGIEQSKEVSAHLKSIDLCLCSSATRTKMTLENAIEGGTKISNTSHLDELYNAPAGVLLNAVQQADTSKNLLLIAHNPGIHQLANILCSEDETTIREKLWFQYAPATLSILDCSIQKWADIQPAQNILLNFITID